MKHARIIALLVVAAGLASTADAQDRKPGARPAKKKISILEARKKWYDRDSKPVRIGERHAIYGGLPKLEKIVSVRDVVKTPGKFKGRDIKIRGEIIKVCEVKGCWATIQADGAEIFARFKNYSFFLPRQADGFPVELEGRVQTEFDNESLERHFDEETSKDDGAKGKKKRINFEAYSVTISEPPASIWEADGGKPLLIYRTHAVYGAFPKMRKQTPLSEIAPRAKAFADKPVRATGTIEQVDKKDGAFLMMRDGDSLMMVRFARADLRIPHSLIGHPVIVEGRVKTAEKKPSHLLGHCVIIHVKKKAPAAIPPKKPAVGEPRPSPKKKSGAEK